MIVVKVGGSLYSEPGLGPALRVWLATLTEPVVVVPGGGGFADAVRELDAVHSLSETESHWLAIQSLSLARHFLQLLIGQDVPILDCYEFFQKHDLTPHSWAVTSDSLALAYAQHQQATKLVLLKSVSLPHGCTWPEAAALDLVDEDFPNRLNRQPLPVELINFPEWMKQSC